VIPLAQAFSHCPATLLVNSDTAREQGDRSVD
jgi:hypothetical protein